MVFVLRTEDIVAFTSDIADLAIDPKERKYIKTLKPFR